MHSIKLYKKSNNSKTITTKKGLFRYTRKPFGIYPALSQVSEDSLP